jgi:hypothetical protein
MDPCTLLILKRKGGELTFVFTLSGVCAHPMHSVIHALSYPSTLTTLSFSPEGGALYFGTGHGVLLVQNLRELGKPPREIVVSTTRARIVAINCQVSSIYMRLDEEIDRLFSLEHG